MALAFKTGVTGTKASSTAATTSGAITLGGAGAATGDCIVVAIGTVGTAVTSVTDNATPSSNTYTAIATSVTNTETISFFAVQSSKSAVTTVTANFGSSRYSVAIAVYTGVNGFSATNTVTNTGSTSPLTATLGTALGSGNWILFAGANKGTGTFSANTGNLRVSVAGASTTTPGTCIVDNTTTTASATNSNVSAWAGTAVELQSSVSISVNVTSPGSTSSVGNESVTGDASVTETGFGLTASCTHSPDYEEINSDDFQRPDTTSISGYYWTTVGASWRGFSISNGDAWANDATAPSLSKHSATLNNDQYAEMTVHIVGTTPPPYQYAGPAIRISGDGGTTTGGCYALQAHNGGGGVIVKYSGGVQVGTGSFSFVDGDKIRIVAQGTSVWAQVNGVTANGPFTDSSVSSGQAGLFGINTSTTQLNAEAFGAKDWACGNYYSSASVHVGIGTSVSAVSYPLMAHTRVFLNQATDNFNRADGSLGANWTTLNLGDNGTFKIASNSVTTNTGGPNYAAIYTGRSWANDQASQVTMVNGVGLSGLILRGTDGAHPTYIYILAYFSSNNMQVGYDNGAGQVILANVTMPTWSAGDVIRAEIRGTKLCVYRNGLPAYCTDNASFPSSGSPGIYLYANAGQTEDNWSGDELQATSVTVSTAVDATVNVTGPALTLALTMPTVFGNASVSPTGNSATSNNGPPTVAAGATASPSGNLLASATTSPSVAGTASVSPTGVSLAASTTAPSVAGGASVSVSGNSLTSSTASSGGWTQVSSDDFNRADGGLGANWTTCTGFGAPAIESNQVRSNGAGFNAAYYSAGSSVGDQYAQLTISTLVTTPSQFLSVGVRMGATAGYVARWSNSSSASLFRIDGSGSVTNIGGLSSPTLNSGDVLRIEASGNAITVYVNGSSIGTVTDSTYAAGYQGLGGNNANANIFDGDNWSSGQAATSLVVTGGATASPTGNVLTSSVGSPTESGNASVSVTESGMASATTAPTVTAGATVNVTSPALTSSVGSPTETGTAVVNPTANGLTSSVGTVTVFTPDAIVNVTGNALAISTKTPTVTGNATVTETGFALAISTAVPPGSGNVSVATDNFNRASLGSNWTLGGNTMSIQSSIYVMGVTGFEVTRAGRIRWNANSFNDDQYSQVQVTPSLGGGGYQAGPAIRLNSTATTGYLVLVNSVSWSIQKYNGSALTSITSGSWSASVGDTIMVQVIGTTLTLYRNGTLVSGSSSTDSTYTTGSVGLCYTDDGAGDASTALDNWDGGNAGTSSTGGVTVSAGASASPTGNSLTASTTTPTETGTAVVSPTAPGMASAVGNVSVSAGGSISVNVTSPALTSSTSTPTVTGTAVINPTGNVATTAKTMPTVTGDAPVSVTSPALTSARGSVTASGTAVVSPAGNATTISSGTPTETGNAPVSVTGSGMTSARGTVTVSANATVNVTSPALTSSVGTATETGTGRVTPTGNALAISTSSVTVQAGGSISVAVSGNALTSATSSPTVAAAANVSPNGTSTTSSVGTVSETGNAVVPVTNSVLSVSTTTPSIAAAANTNVSGTPLAISRGSVTVSAAANALPSGGAIASASGSPAVSGAAVVSATGPGSASSTSIVTVTTGSGVTVSVPGNAMAAAVTGATVELVLEVFVSGPVSTISVGLADAAGDASVDLAGNELDLQLGTVVAEAVGTRLTIVFGPSGLPTHLHVDQTPKRRDELPPPSRDYYKE